MKNNNIREELNKSTVYDKNISKELENSFLEYAMSVIVARALPDARDGFKPVHRRVLFAAYGLGMTSGSAHKKSARLVGEVIGKFHPHGDSAVYETMVRLAQDFSMRYPLIDGHGNFGSVDGDFAAAMRYTEARLSKIADTLLFDIDKNTVNFVDNYDGSETEPVVLPSLFPNMLANGASGIAVGMATNIPPHNLNEIVDATILVAKNPETTVSQIQEVLHGPDFPTKGEIVGTTGITDYFNTGRGSVIVRSKVDIEYLENNKPVIIVKEIPYLVNKKTLIEKIIDLVKNEQIDGITDLRDESSREGIRIMIELRKDIVPEVLLNKLFKMTQLQSNFSVNMLALVNGEPKLLNIKQSIEIYLEHQIEVLTRKTTFDLKKAQDRLHILEGLHIASEHVDEIIAIIKKSDDSALLIQELMSTFKLSELQAKSILDMKLRSLSAMEQGKIVSEINQLDADVKRYNELLSNRENKINLIIENLKKLVDKFGDKRATEILYNASADIDDEDLIPKQDIVITMSNRGYLKRMPIDTYRNQKRGGTGVMGLSTNNDDSVQNIIVANTHTDILMFSDFGKIYRLRGHEIPLGSRQSKGIPAINFLQVEKNERILSILPIDSYENNYLLFATINGIVKKTELKEFVNINVNGKRAITLKDNDKLFSVCICYDSDEAYIASSNGRLVRFNTNDVRTMGRTASGVKGINVSDGSFVVGFSTSRTGNKILSVGSKGIGKISDAELYRLTKRGSKGVWAIKVTPKTGKLVFAGAINGDEQSLIVTKNNKIIRFSLEQIRETGRNTSGVKLMNIEGNDRIQSVAIFSGSDAIIDEQSESFNE